MTRRCDYVTAEPVDLTLLARAAFGDLDALRYAVRAGLPVEVNRELLARTFAETRCRRLCSYSADQTNGAECLDHDCWDAYCRTNGENSSLLFVTC